MNDDLRPHVYWWWPFKPLQLKWVRSMTEDNLDFVVGTMIGWGLSGHDVDRLPGYFRFRRLLEFMVQHQDEVESMLPEVMVSVRPLLETAAD